jgi:hypothetical protein
LDVAGDAWEDYGALAVTGLATLDGRLGIDLTDGFTLRPGDTFDDIFTSDGALSGDFSQPLGGRQPVLGQIDQRLALLQRRSLPRSEHRQEPRQRGVGLGRA